MTRTGFTNQRLIRGIGELSNHHKPSAVSIGNFDGVHLGHQYVIRTLLDKSAELGVPATVVTFEPLAKEFFAPDSTERLTSIEERAELLFALGVDQVLCIDFTAEFASYSPLGFVEDVLINGLGITYLSVGDDFRFGKDRIGDFAYLKELGNARGFTVNAHQTYELDGQRVSSGRVRVALREGDFALAERLLGRPYTITGTVSEGQKLGRTLNFPTANIDLPKTRLPVNGVYAVTAVLDNNESLKGVANIGKRPTVDGKQNRLEVFLFDFERDIYGAELVVKFHYKIRDEQKFDSLDALKEQISKDSDCAREYLALI